MICPICCGHCDENEIQLKIIQLGDDEYFECPKCENFFCLQSLDPDGDEGIIFELRKVKGSGKNNG